MKTRSKTSLFLIELILMILLFAFSAAVCMRIFAFAKITSDESRALDFSVLAAQSAAEGYKSCGGDLLQTATLLSGEVSSEGNVLVCYDADFKKTAEEGAYTLVLREQNGRGIVEISKNKEETVLFSIEVKAVHYGD